MKINLNEQSKQNILAYTISGILIAVVWFLLQNFSAVRKVFHIFSSAMMPFVLGGAFAFILLPLRRWIENQLLKKLNWTMGVKRKIAVAISMIVFALVIASFFIILIPQLMSSVQTLAGSMDSYLNSFNQISQTITDDIDLASLVSQVYEAAKDFISPLVSGENGIVASVVNYSVSVVQSIFHFFVGVIVAVYLLADFERFQVQARKVIYSVFSKQRAEYVFYVSRLTSKMFSSFIYGKALDSLIIGIVTLVVCWLMSFPYAVLIAFVIGVTNMIPVFGPFIGAVPSIFILLIISPTKAAEFSIFILILQQIDGNILGPRILGDSLGLPALWVLFSIIAGGALFGIVGMFLGVPMFSVIYVLIRELIHERLRQKKIEI